MSAAPSSARTLPAIASVHLEKAKEACVAAVENYNKPGTTFRTRTYAILMTIAWTALFHAIFHRRGTKPWYKENGSGGEVKYKVVDGEPWHWELAECTRRYYLADSSPQRKNLEFMIALRNKIEHRDHPELDPALYGQCQAMLMNFEELLTKEFGDEHAVSGQPAVALQFSALRPEAQKEALARLESSTATDLLDFIRQFHAELPQEVLDSASYSLRVFLVPRLANRAKSADLAVRFVSYDPSRPEEMEALRAVTALIKEKHVAVASHGLKKPSEVVRLLRGCLSYRVTMHTHTMAWKFYDVRPATGAKKPEATQSQYCVYDALAGSYGYTQAWINHLCNKLGDPQEFERVTGRPPVRDRKKTPVARRPTLGGQRGLHQEAGHTTVPEQPGTDSILTPA